MVPFMPTAGNVGTAQPGLASVAPRQLPIGVDTSVRLPVVGGSPMPRLATQPVQAGVVQSQPAVNGMTPMGRIGVATQGVIRQAMPGPAGVAQQPTAQVGSLTGPPVQTVIPAPVGQASVAMTPRAVIGAPTAQLGMPTPTDQATAATVPRAHIGGGQVGAVNPRMPLQPAQPMAGAPTSRIGMFRRPVF